MLLFALLGMNANRYYGVITRFASGDNQVVNADLASLEQLMIGETLHRDAMNLTPGNDVAPDAKKVYLPQPGAPPDCKAPRYPPKNPQWELLHKAHQGKGCCGACFNLDSFH